jgi:hypothetical protein
MMELSVRYKFVTAGSEQQQAIRALSQPTGCRESGICGSPSEDQSSLYWGNFEVSY